MKTRDGKKFIVTEEHSTISPCTLPEWLPRDIIEKMVTEFGTNLRRELVKLEKSTKVLRCRFSSTDTRRMSLETIAGADMDDLDDKSVHRAFGKSCPKSDLE